MNYKITTIALAGLIVAGLLLAPELFAQPTPIPTSASQSAGAVVPTETIDAANHTNEVPPTITPAPTQKAVEQPFATTTAPTPNVTLIVEGTAYSGFIPQSTTVLELMQTLASTGGLVFTGREYTSLGFFVETLNGKRAADGNVWILWVNGKKSGEGVSTMRIRPHDVVEWKYEKSY